MHGIGGLLMNDGVIDNAKDLLGNRRDIPGVMQFAVVVDNATLRFRYAEFMHYLDALQFADIIFASGAFKRVAVERVR